MEKLFESMAATPKNPNWQNIISRKAPLYTREGDVRTDFERDYTRIIHSNSFRRLKHKTQVFFSPENDHICTRIEHVTHVESISYTIANYLGLNTELTKAISVAHDLGHSPFGHSGEKILSQISKRDLGHTFWHEKNGLEFVDNIELLEDNERCKQNLNLTYAVRDGIISHCGEIDENCIKPRNEFMDLSNYQRPNQYSPYTWEALVVKISDKILGHLSPYRIRGLVVFQELPDHILRFVSVDIVEQWICDLRDRLRLIRSDELEVNHAGFMSVYRDKIDSGFQSIPTVVGKGSAEGTR